MPSSSDQCSLNSMDRPLHWGFQQQRAAASEHPGSVSGRTDRHKNSFFLTAIRLHNQSVADEVWGNSFEDAEQQNFPLGLIKVNLMYVILFCKVNDPFSWMLSGEGAFDITM